MQGVASEAGCSSSSPGVAVHGRSMFVLGGVQSWIEIKHGDMVLLEGRAVAHGSEVLEAPVDKVGRARCDVYGSAFYVKGADVKTAQELLRGQQEVVLRAAAGWTGARDRAVG